MRAVRLIGSPVALGGAAVCAVVVMSVSFGGTTDDGGGTGRTTLNRQGPSEQTPPDGQRAGSWVDWPPPGLLDAAAPAVALVAPGTRVPSGHRGSRSGLTSPNSG